MKQTGAMDQMLQKIADFYEEEVDAAVDALTSLIEPIMMVFLGVVVGGIAHRDVPADLQDRGGREVGRVMSAGRSRRLRPRRARAALARLLAARLVLAIFAFVLALALSPEGRSDRETLASGPCSRSRSSRRPSPPQRSNRVRRLAAFGVVQLITDVAMVTAMVLFSGSGVSAFGFLYLPITVFGAVLFDRRGAYGSALLSSAAYAATLAWSGAAMPANAAVRALERADRRAADRRDARERARRASCGSRASVST